MIEKILAAGASIIIRPVGWNSLSTFGIAVEFHGLRHGIACGDLEEGLAEAYKWVQDVEFYHGAQWTSEQMARLRARAA